MPPLVIWGVAVGAEELLALTGVLAVGATITAQQNAQSGARARSLPFATAQTCPSCSQSSTQDPCKDLGDQIATRRNELTKRYQEMREDKFGLYAAGPAGVPGVGSWEGHVQQFQYKQTNLRKLLRAWTHLIHWVSMTARQVPARKLRASLSYRVAIARQSLTRQKARSMTFRSRYATALNGCG